MFRSVLHFLIQYPIPIVMATYFIHRSLSAHLGRTMRTLLGHQIRIQSYHHRPFKIRARAICHRFPIFNRTMFFTFFGIRVLRFWWFSLRVLSDSSVVNIAFLPMELSVSCDGYSGHSCTFSPTFMGSPMLSGTLPSRPDSYGGSSGIFVYWVLVVIFLSLYSTSLLPRPLQIL